MIPIKLSLHNFMSYQQAILDFNNFDFAVLTGKNGAGKSTILEAITWAIWGETRAGNDDSLVYQGANEMWVELVFESDKNIYRVLRRRDKKGRGQSILEFQISHKNLYQSLAEPTIRQTQEKIIKTIHLAYDIFVNSSYLRQGHADEFTIKSPIERKEILAEILNLEIYDKLAEKAKEKLKEKQLEEQNLSYEIQTAEEIVSREKEIEIGFEKASKNLARLKTKLKKERTIIEDLSNKKNRKEILENKKEQLSSEYSRIQDLIKDNLEKIESYEKEIENKKTILENKNEIEKKYQDLKLGRKKSGELTKKLLLTEKFEKEKAIILHQKEELEKTIKRLEHLKNCPTCLRELTEKEAKKIIRDLNNNFEKKYYSKLNCIEKELKAIGYDRAEHQKTEKLIKELSISEEEKQKLDRATTEIKNLKNQDDNLEKQNQNFKKILVGIKEEGLEIKKEIEKLTPDVQKWQEKQSEISALQDDLEELNYKMGELTHQKKMIAENKQKIKSKEKTIKDILIKKGIYSDLALIYSKKGIQAMIIEEVIPAIEDECNLLLGKITENRLRLELKTQRAKKFSEELMETLDILISDELGTRPYELYSGGEAFRINFALRLAISKLLAYYSGASLKFLVIDEGFGALDSAGREDIVSAINAIKNDFEKILIVTHLEELKDVFETKIEVTKTEKGSELKIIA